MIAEYCESEELRMIAAECGERVAAYDIEAIIHRLVDAYKKGRGWRGRIGPLDSTYYQIGITPPGPDLTPIVSFGCFTDYAAAPIYDMAHVTLENHMSSALWRRITAEFLDRIQQAVS